MNIRRTSRLDRKRARGYSSTVRLSPLLAFVLLLQTGCGVVKRVFSPGRDPKVTQSIRDQLKDKRFVTVVYEGVASKDVRLENVLRFQQSALLDEALVELKQKVSDRGPIQPILETQRLPESGSFKAEDLTKIGTTSGADVLILGYFTTTLRDGLISTHRDHKMILRAVNLKTHEVINSVQSDGVGDDAWKKLARVLFRER